jgi:hypothetical protein
MHLLCHLTNELFIYLLCQTNELFMHLLYQTNELIIYLLCQTNKLLMYLLCILFLPIKYQRVFVALSTTRSWRRVWAWAAESQRGAGTTLAPGRSGSERAAS